MNKLNELINKLCPDGVPYSSLGDLCEVITRGAMPSFVKEGINFIKIESLTGTKIDESKLFHISEETHYGPLKRSILQENDILFATYGATIGKCAIVPKKILPANTNQLISIIRLKDKSLTRYIFYLLTSDLMKNFKEEKSKNGAQPFFTLQHLKQFKLPLPPLEIQKEIVRILDTFTSITAELILELTTEFKLRKKQYEYYKNHLLSFKNLNPQLNELINKLCPDGVPYSSLGDLCEVIIHGTDTANLKKEGINFIKVESIKDSKIDESKLFYISEETHYGPLKRSILQENDILISINGTIGKCVVVSQDILPANINYAIAIIRLKDKSLTRYIFHLLTSDLMKKYKETKSKGVTLSNLSLSNLKQFKLPLPPLEIQKEIVRILDCFDDLTYDILKGLPAEIKARQKQYEYYRGLLLNFKEKKEEK